MFAVGGNDGQTNTGKLTLVAAAAAAAAQYNTP